MNFLMNERIAVAVILFVAPLVLLALSVGAEFADLGGAFSPMFFPVIVLFFWAGVAGLTLLTELRQSGRAHAIIPAGRWLQIAGVVLAMALFVYATTRLGFLLSGIGFVFVTLLILGLRGPVLLIGYSIALPGALFVLFHHGLGLPLPTSPFSYLF